MAKCLEIGIRDLSSNPGTRWGVGVGGGGAGSLILWPQAELGKPQEDKFQLTAWKNRQEHTKTDGPSTDDKQNVVCTHNGILLFLRIKTNPDTWYSVDES